MMLCGHCLNIASCYSLDNFKFTKKLELLCQGPDAVTASGPFFFLIMAVIIKKNRIFAAEYDVEVKNDEENLLPNSAPATDAC